MKYNAFIESEKRYSGKYSTRAFFLSTEAEAESLPVCNGLSRISLFNHTDEEAQSGETSASQTNSIGSKEPPLLRELNPDLLQSGKLKLTGKCLSDIKNRAEAYSTSSYCTGGNAYYQCYHSVVMLVSSAL